MVARLAVIGAIGLSFASPSATLRAHLFPAVPSSSAAGVFDARTAVMQSGVAVHWRLSFSGLSGRATKATLRIGGSALGLPLCAPCAARASDELLLTRTAWRDLVAHGATVVVATRAHPSGELRGPVRRS